MPYNGTTPPPKPQRPVPELHKYRGVRIFLIGGGIAVFTVLVVGTAMSMALSNMFGDLDFDIGRDHLAPIPIAASACPNVVAMHKAANRFQSAMPVLGMTFDAHARPLKWPKAKARLLRVTNQLDFLIVASTPQFPEPVQRYLTKVHKDLGLGRLKLANARSGDEFSDRSTHLIDDGQLAFGYAGDLIGHRCRVQLGADTATMLPDLTDTTTTTRPARHASDIRRH